MKEERITISLEEYKELLEIKGKYEEVKEQKEIVKYIPITIHSNWIDTMPKVTWTTF